MSTRRCDQTRVCFACESRRFVQFGTVGAVCVDQWGNVAAGTSTGGVRTTPCCCLLLTTLHRNDKQTLWTRWRLSDHWRGHIRVQSNVCGFLHRLVPFVDVDEGSHIGSHLWLFRLWRVFHARVRSARRCGCHEIHQMFAPRGHFHSHAQSSVSFVVLGSATGRFAFRRIQ